MFSWHPSFCQIILKAGQAMPAKNFSWQRLKQTRIPRESNWIIDYDPQARQSTPA
jgi:hypothetical protein